MQTHIDELLNLPSYDIEQEFLAYILQDSMLIEKYDLDVQEFMNDEHRQAYKVMLDMFYQDVKLDTYSLMVRLVNYVMDDKVNKEGLSQDKVHAYIEGIKNWHMRHETEPESLFQAIRLRAFRKKGIDLHKELAPVFLKDDQAEIIRKCENFVLNVQEGYQESSPHEPPELIAAYHDHIARIEQGKDLTIPTGFAVLDDKIPGIVPSYWVIGGHRSVGKSSFAGELIYRLVENGAKGVLFSLEDSTEIKTMKFLARMTGIPFKKIHRHDTDMHERRDIEKASDEFREWPITVYDDCRTCEEIHLRSKKAKVQKDIDFIVVDYIQNIYVPDIPDIYNQMRHVSMQLYLLQKKLNICVILLSQVNKEYEMKGARELEAQADVLIRLKREIGHQDYEMRKCMSAEIIKNRIFGPLGFNHDALQLKFTDTWTELFDFQFMTESAVCPYGFDVAGQPIQIHQEADKNGREF